MIKEVVERANAPLIGLSPLHPFDLAATLTTFPFFVLETKTGGATALTAIKLRINILMIDGAERMTLD